MTNTFCENAMNLICTIYTYNKLIYNWWSNKERWINNFYYQKRSNRMAKEC
jgi:hypothetical protein